MAICNRAQFLSLFYFITEFKLSPSISNCFVDCWDKNQLQDVLLHWFFLFLMRGYSLPCEIPYWHLNVVTDTKLTDLYINGHRFWRLQKKKKRQIKTNKKQWTFLAEQIFARRALWNSSLFCRNSTTRLRSWYVHIF